MSENVTNELILEHLKRLQEGPGRVMERLDRVESRLSAIESHMATMVHSVSRVDGDLDALARRVDRIEQRLELTD